MARTDLTALPDGSTLRQLASGLEIVRRRKHEPIDFDELASGELERRTNKINGSKFMPHWTLPVLVGWIEQQADAMEPGQPQLLKVRLNEAVGYSEGVEVYTIAIRCDGRYIHAYPEKDE